ncbi:MAG: hypothetical protein V4463_20020 [Pseudomonadota bacterium]
MTEAGTSGALTPAAQLDSYIDRLDPKNQKLIRAIRTALRKRFPTANELAYDYTTFLVIGYSPSERGIESIVAVAARPTGVFLYFNQGPQLPDPTKILQGKGKQTRFIQLETASRLLAPEVEALVRATIEQAKIPFPSEGKGNLIMMSETSRKRPRRA